MKKNQFIVQQQVAGRQRGAVLVISLIVLLVLTLMGVAGMNSSLMQERMAGNAQSSNQAFQAAESAVGAVIGNLRNGNLATLRQSMDAPDSLSNLSAFTIGGDAINASFQVRYLGEVIITSGSSMDANESSTLLTGYRYELSGNADVEGNGASSTVFKGIEYY